MSIFIDGELSRYSFWTSQGLLDAMAEIEVEGSTLIVIAPAVYAGDGTRIHPGVKQMLEIVRQVEALAKLQGFTRLQVTGKRLSGAKARATSLSQQENPMIHSVPYQDAVSSAEALCLWQERADTESFLRAMRELGAWQIESIKAVRQFSGISLAEAKEIVHFSATWADMRESAEAVHEAAYQAIEDYERMDRAAETEPARLAG